MCFSQGDSFDIDRESSDSTREQTPDSDSGYMASCVTVVSTTSSISKTFQQPKPLNSSQSSDHLAKGPPQNKGGTPAINTYNNAASNNRPNFLAEMQSAQQRRRVSQENISETGNSIPSTNNNHNEVPKRDLPLNSSNNGDTQNVGKPNVSSSLADQLKIRLEERRKHSDESETQDLAADVQKAVNIANESSKFIYNILVIYVCRPIKIIFRNI